MTPRNFKKYLVDLGLTQVDAAKFFCVSERKVRRWCQGLYPVDRAVELCLILMVKYGESPGYWKVRRPKADTTSRAG